MPTVNGKQVASIGYGLMGLTWRASPPSEKQAIAAMRAALASGCNFWNGGEFYGPPQSNSLTLLKKYYKKYPDDANKVVLSIKGCFGYDDMTPDCTPEGVRKSVENCLAMLGGRGKIDIFEPARRDPKVPLEQTLSALAELAKEGKIGGVALSEVSAKTIREAARITKLAAVEVELSLWQTDPLSNGITEACKELNIPVVAYSPIGSGILTGQIKSFDEIPEHDLRKASPRFQPGNFEINMQLVHALEKFAKTKNCTPAQLAINWIRSLSKRPDMPVIIPIPGATTAERVGENSRVVDLTKEELREIDDILASFKVVGSRTPPIIQHLADG